MSDEIDEEASEAPTLSALVRAFHAKHGFAIGRELRVGKLPGDRDDVVLSTAARLRSVTPRIGLEDLRVARLNLIVEEAAELAEAMHNRDAVAMADAVADLAYVVVGTAVAYGLPLERLFEEVHASNMTKDVSGTHKPRKGEAYREPRIGHLLNRHSAQDRGSAR